MRGGDGNIPTYSALRRDRFERLEALRTGDGRELPPLLKAEIRRELDRIALATTQLAAVERARDALIRTEAEECHSAWNKDPVFGVIGIQSGPRG